MAFRLPFRAIATIPVLCVGTLGGCVAATQHHADATGSYQPRIDAQQKPAPGARMAGGAFVHPGLLHTEEDFARMRVNAPRGVSRGSMAGNA